MKISIVIPVYNSEKYLTKCHHSLLEQTYPFIEVIYVNDGSTDSSKEILEKLISEQVNSYPVFKIINQKNQGVSQARNQGISVAQGDYLLFVDSDDYVAPDFCEKMWHLVEKNEADIGICNYYLVKTNGLYANHLPSTIQPSQNHFKDLPAAILSIIGANGFKGFVWNKIYKASCLKEIMFSKEIHYLEDLIFNLQLFNQVKKIVYTTESLYYYRLHEESAVQTFNEKQLTYLSAIKKAEEFVPTKLQPLVTGNRVTAIINFAGLANQAHQKALYQKMKEAFELIDNDSFLPFLRIDQKMIFYLAKINFKLGCQSAQLVNKLFASQLYNFVRTKYSTHKQP